MTVLITLTTAGSDSGPFNLYSNIDGYTLAFESAVAKSSLLAGYYSSAVPDSTTIIKVLSTGACTNYIEIPVIGTTTTTSTTIAPTTTTTTTVAPTTTTTTTASPTTTTTTTINNIYLVRNVSTLQEVTVASNIGALTIGYFVTLLGGGYTGCWEVLSNTGVFPATSVVAQYPDANCDITTTTTTTLAPTTTTTTTVAPTTTTTTTTAPPAACTSYTVGTSSGTGQSYTYTACDGTPYEGSVGGSGGHDADTFCAQTGTVTLVGSELTLIVNEACSTPTTTTTTTAVNSYVYLFSSPGSSNIVGACAKVTFPLTRYASTNTIDLGSRIFNNSDLTNPFSGDNLWFLEGQSGAAYQIDGSGYIIDTATCYTPGDVSLPGSQWSSISHQAACGNAPGQLYTNCVAIEAGQGCILYTDQIGTVLQGNPYVFLNAAGAFGNYDVNPTTGEVLNYAPVQC